MCLNFSMIFKSLNIIKSIFKIIKKFNGANGGIRTHTDYPANFKFAMSAIPSRWHFRII